MDEKVVLDPFYTYNCDDVLEGSCIGFDCFGEPNVEVAVCESATMYRWPSTTQMCVVHSSRPAGLPRRRVAAGREPLPPPADHRRSSDAI